MEKEQMLVATLNKVGQTMVGINGMMTSSFEMETYSSVDPNQVRYELNRVDGGATPSDKKYDGVNEGNGWNEDAHADGTVQYNDDLAGWYDLEVSSSPLNNFEFEPMKAEIEKMLTTLGRVTTLKHSVMASCHIHTTIRYTREHHSVVPMNQSQVYNRIGRFMLKFMPVMKWLTMTSYTGARGSVVKSRNRIKNGFDRLENDKLFEWWDEHDCAINPPSDRFLKSMERQSYLRIHNASVGDNLHWENRMADQTASHTQLALNISINRAITLWAIDMARKGYNLELDYHTVNKVKDQMYAFRDNYMNVDYDFIQEQWKEMKGYLTKYLYIMGSFNAIKYGDKLIEKPIPSWLAGKGYREHFNPFEIEQAFNERNRGKDEQLRKDYLIALDSMAVGVAENLNDFHLNVARHLGIDEKQAKSLYQMFNRENVDIRFLGGRLVLMGE